MKPASAKAKGRRLQDKIVSNILALFPSLEPDDVRGAIMGERGEDIKFSPAARRLFNYSVECKARAKTAVQTDYEQAKRNAPAGAVPLVVSKADRKEPLVTMAWTDFERLIR